MGLDTREAYRFAAQTRLQEFSAWGPGPTDSNLSYRGGVQWFISRKTIIFHATGGGGGGEDGGPIGVGQFFPLCVCGGGV